MNSKNRKFSRKKQERRDIIKEAKSIGCWYCRENDVCCMEFHHLFGKDGEVSRFLNPQKIRQEISKYIVVCSNCHKKIHAGLYDSPSFSGKYEEVYKVVDRECGDIYKSLTCLYGAIQYNLYKKAVPKIPHSKLFVFRSLECAKIFTASYQHILLVKAYNIHSIKKVCRNPSLDKDFWYRKKKHLSIDSISTTAPLNSFVCDELIPLSVIDK